MKASHQKGLFPAEFPSSHTKLRGALQLKYIFIYFLAICEEF